MDTKQTYEFSDEELWVLKYILDQALFSSKCYDGICFGGVNHLLFTAHDLKVLRKLAERINNYDEDTLASIERHFLIYESMANNQYR